MCNASDSIDDMVECDKCDLWFHYTCVGVDGSISEQEFICAACSNANHQSPKSQSTPTSLSTTPGTSLALPITSSLTSIVFSNLSSRTTACALPTSDANTESLFLPTMGAPTTTNSTAESQELRSRLPLSVHQSFPCIAQIAATTYTATFATATTIAPGYTLASLSNPVQAAYRSIDILQPILETGTSQLERWSQNKHPTSKFLIGTSKDTVVPPESQVSVDRFNFASVPVCGNAFPTVSNAKSCKQSMASHAAEITSNHPQPSVGPANSTQRFSQAHVNSKHSSRSSMCSTKKRMEIELKS